VRGAPYRVLWLPRHLCIFPDVSALGHPPPPANPDRHHNARVFLKKDARENFAQEPGVATPHAEGISRVKGGQPGKHSTRSKCCAAQQWGGAQREKPGSVTNHCADTYLSRQ